MIVTKLNNAILIAVSLIWPNIYFQARVVELLKNSNYGDYASNVSFLLSPKLNLAPIVIAKQIVDCLRNIEDLVEVVEIVNPGFINFRVFNIALQQIPIGVISAGDRYGSYVGFNKKALIECISANPTGPLHLGHARPIFAGETISRLLESTGFIVVREYYVNDVGNKINKFGRSIYLRYCELFGHPTHVLENSYPGDYVIEIAKKLKEIDGDIWLFSSNYLKRFIQFGIKENLRQIKNTLKKIGIKVNSWCFESSLYLNGTVSHIIYNYSRQNLLYKSQKTICIKSSIRRLKSKSAQFLLKQGGGTFLRTSKFGDEQDRVILRKDNTPVYLVGDAAYHQSKFTRKFDCLINIFGADHAGHIPRLQSCISALSFDNKKIRSVLVQMVKMLKNKVELCFSKRSGQIIHLTQLIDEIGVDGARIIFLTRSVNTQFDFNLDLIFEKNNENPIFYIQYGYARMVTILSKFNFKDFEFPNFSLLTLQEEKAILKKIDFYPVLVQNASDKLEPHHVLFYCQELITDFHSYFTRYKNSNKIISSNLRLTGARLGLILALRQTLSNGLKILDVSAPDYMKYG